MVKQLHIGCGKRDFGNDWFHIDGADFPHIKHNNVKYLPFKGESIDLIYSSHLIAYFDRDEVVKLFKEWKRVLKSGGILRLATPDFEAINDLYMRGDFPLENFLGPLYGKMNLKEDIIYHKTTYDLKSLTKMLLFEVGFKEVKKYDWKETNHAKFDDHSQAYLPHLNKESGTLISLNVEAVK